MQALMERIETLEAGLREAQRAGMRKGNSDVRLLAGMLGVDLAVVRSDLFHPR